MHTACSCFVASWKSCIALLSMQLIKRPWSTTRPPHCVMVADGALAHDALQRSSTGARCLYHSLERPQHTAEQSLRTVGCNMASPVAAAAEAAGPDGTMFDYPVIEEMDPSLGEPRMPFLCGGTAHTHSTWGIHQFMPAWWDVQLLKTAICVESVDGMGTTDCVPNGGPLTSPCTLQRHSTWQVAPPPLGTMCSRWLPAVL